MKKNRKKLASIRLTELSTFTELSKQELKTISGGTLVNLNIGANGKNGLIFGEDGQSVSSSGSSRKKLNLNSEWIRILKSNRKLWLLNRNDLLKIINSRFK